MWVKNKLTGKVWEVYGELAERLSVSEDFEEIKAPEQVKDNPLAEETEQAQAEKKEKTQAKEKKTVTQAKK